MSFCTPNFTVRSRNSNKFRPRNICLMKQGMLRKLSSFFLRFYFFGGWGGGGGRSPTLSSLVEIMLPSVGRKHLLLSEIQFLNLVLLLAVLLTRFTSQRSEMWFSSVISAQFSETVYGLYAILWPEMNVYGCFPEIEEIVWTTIIYPTTFSGWKQREAWTYRR
jgi:hypothetical protein